MADMKFIDTLEEVLLERGFPLDIVQSVLETVQTIDAVEVVRCKDCKHWVECNDVGYCDNPDGLDNYAKPNDFCSYGERRNNAAD